ncbi:MAG: cyclic nucleotide-binding domain-containing protein [Anaerolineae bacterium]|nr:cyclic nucleotide-binding domain-containing protein [Anaerolineae bacterium]
MATRLSFVSRWLGWQPTSDPVFDHATDNNLLIDLRQVVKTYQTPAGSFTALKGVDLQVKPGEFVAVIGKSGSGKSTLINMVTGIDRPTMGEVYVSGAPIHKFNETQNAKWRGRKVGVIFQFFQLLPTLSIIENIMMPMEFCGLYSWNERRERAMHLLDLVGMADQSHKLPAMVSGGQQQRAAIARALANDPDILIADEPTGSLDSKTADTIFELFEDFVAQGKTILMVTHDRDLASRVSRVVLIADGDIADRSIAHALPALDSKQLVQISTKLTPISYSPGSIIFHQGDPADLFYIIIKGQVEIVKQHASGEEVVVATLENGQYFGEMGLLESGQRNATARVGKESHVVLMGLERDSFADLMQNSDLTQNAIARLMRQRTTADHLLQALPDVNQQQLAHIETTYKRLTYEPGQIIFRQGDPADKFYLIIKGEVDVLHPYHEDETIQRLTSGQYFGEFGLQNGGYRRRTVRAAPDMKTPVETIALDKETFIDLVTHNNMVGDEVALTMRQFTLERLETYIPQLKRRARAGTHLLDVLVIDDE